MSSETLEIHNFAGISHASLELGRINLLIGPQASGKSVCAKLLFYFKESIRRMVLGVIEEKGKAQIRSDDVRLFLTYFPPGSWSRGEFSIRYSCGTFSLAVARKSRESSTVEIDYPSAYDDMLGTVRRHLRAYREQERRQQRLPGFLPSSLYEDLAQLAAGWAGPALVNRNYFIPAGRSFFSTLRSSVFSLIVNDIGIDPFLAEFGRLYESHRNLYHTPAFDPDEERPDLEARMQKVICGTYLRVKGEDFIRMADGRQIPISSGSSGQQEALPLAITLASVIRRAVWGSLDDTLFVEEPEAHLYPSAQREIVHLFAAAMDLATEGASSQYFITTHSPYILSALNNLMYGGKIAREAPEKREAVARVLGEEVLIDPVHVRAWFIEQGTLKSILDPETGLILASTLDQVSGDLAREFETLLSIDFPEEAS